MANTETSGSTAKGTDAGGPGGRAGLKIHHLRPAPGARTPKTRVGRGAGVQGQDRGSRHEGQQGQD